MKPNDTRVNDKWHRAIVWQRVGHAPFFHYSVVVFARCAILCICLGPLICEKEFAA